MEFFVSTGIVGSAVSVTRWVIRQSFDALFKKSKWYKKLPELRRHRLSGAMTVALHHCAVVGGLTSALGREDADMYELALLGELGFDIFDSLAAAMWSGSFTGMTLMPVVVHHSVAIFFTLVGLQPRLVRWDAGAQLGANLLTAGAVDVLVLRVVPFTPLYKSSSIMTAISVAHLAVFAKCRVFHYISAARSLLNSLPGDSGLWTPLAAACGALFMYHIVLGVALARAALNNGRLPKLSKEFVKSMRGGSQGGRTGGPLGKEERLTLVAERLLQSGRQPKANGR